MVSQESQEAHRPSDALEKEQVMPNTTRTTIYLGGDPTVTKKRLEELNRIAKRYELSGVSGLLQAIADGTVLVLKPAESADLAAIARLITQLANGELSISK